MLQLFQPTTDYEEVRAISEVLASHWLGKGEKVAEFEAAWSGLVGAQPSHMVSTGSCTQALFEAGVLAGLGPGDKVIIPSIHFVGAAQAVLAVGATPVYCDVDPYTLNARTTDIAGSMTRYVKAVIFNHYGGVSPKVDRNHIPDNVIIIDDLACHPMANFATLGRSDFATWSFDSMKTITTGDGGLLWCKDPTHAAKARQDFCLGVDNGSGASSKKPKWWEFEVRVNGRGRHLLNDMQAAMGLAQLGKLPGLVARRKEIVQLYDMILNDVEKSDADFLYEFGEVPYYFSWVQTPLRDELAAYLRSKDVYTSFRYWPLHLAYNTSINLPNAERAARENLLLPLHANLTNEEVRYICKTVQEFYAHP